MNYDVAIIGGGVTGISAALQLESEGISYVIIEKEFYAGGRSLQLCCKASDRCNKCGACTADHTIKEIFLKANGNFFEGACLKSAEEKGGKFNIKFEQRPSCVAKEKCTKCGKCVEVCPVEGKAVKMPPFMAYPGFPYIDKDLCLRQRGEECTKCSDACPHSAIDYSGGAENVEVNASSVILAVGLNHYDPSGKSSYHYGAFRNIISGQELEEQIRRNGKLTRPSDGKIPSSVAFIQCAGSRDPRNANAYCSQICCLFAMRSSLHIKEDFPDTRIKIFYMDLQADCKDEMEIVERCKKTIEFERSMPGVIVEKEEGRIGLTYESLDENKNVEEEFDLLVLSTGIAPSKSNPEVAKMFGLEVGDDGFIKGGDDSDKTKTAKEKIFIAGGCEGPKNALLSIVQGASAARNALSAVAGRREEIA